MEEESKDDDTLSMVTDTTRNSDVTISPSGCQELDLQILNGPRKTDDLGQLDACVSPVIPTVSSKVLKTSTDIRHQNESEEFCEESDSESVSLLKNTRQLQSQKSDVTTVSRDSDHNTCTRNSQAHLHSSDQSDDDSITLTDTGCLSYEEKHKRQKDVLRRIEIKQERLLRKTIEAETEDYFNIQQKIQLVQSLLKQIIDQQKSERISLALNVKSSQKTKSELYQYKQQLKDFGEKQTLLSGLIKKQNELRNAFRKKFGVINFVADQQNENESTGETVGNDVLQHTLDKASGCSKGRNTPVCKEISVTNVNINNVVGTDSPFRSQPFGKRSSIEDENTQKRTESSYTEDMNKLKASAGEALNPIKNIDESVALSCEIPLYLKRPIETQKNEIQTKRFKIYEVNVAPVGNMENQRLVMDPLLKGSSRTDSAMRIEESDSKNQREVPAVKIPAFTNMNFSTTLVNQMSDKDNPKNHRLQETPAISEGIGQALNSLKTTTLQRSGMTMGNMSPSTASYSDVFPIKSKEINRRMRQRRLMSSAGEVTQSQGLLQSSNYIAACQQNNEQSSIELKTQFSSQETVNDTFGDFKFPPLITLINRNILQPGNGVLSINHKNVTFIASLTTEGTIIGKGGELFRTPVQWSRGVLQDTKVKKYRAYREIHYKGYPLVKYIDDDVNRKLSGGCLAEDSELLFDSPCTDNVLSQTSPNQDLVPLSELLRRCSIRLIAESDFVPAEDLPEDFWSLDFSSVRLQHSLVSEIDMWD